MQHPNTGIRASLDDLRLFAAIGGAPSFVEAARRARIPTSTLSRRLAELEEALGTRLVHRTTRQMALTREGEELLARTREHLDALDDALSGAKADEPSGRLRVTAMLATGAELVAPALMEFAKRYPRVTVELNLTNAVVPIIEDAFDIAFRSAPIIDGDLVARRIARWSYVLAAAPGIVASRLSVDALRSAPAVLTRHDATWQLLKKDGSVEPIRPEARFIVDDPRVALEAAAAGLGLVAAPADRLEAYGNRLVRVAVVGRTVAPREVYAVYASRKLVPARVRAALDWVARAAAKASG